MSSHRFTVRVYYEDTDAGGVVYHASFLAFAERGRAEMMRRVAGDDAGRRSPAVLCVVRSCEIDYRRSARLDDLLLVQTRLVAIGGASFRLQQDICRDGEVLVVIRLTLVCVREIGHPTRIPDRLRQAMTVVLNS